MKNTSPSAQTEWEKEFDTIAYEECMYGNPTFDSRGFYKCKDFIRTLLASERTRLLSVESMKMEEVPEEIMLKGIHFVNEHAPITRNELRQSILSEMEKGSV